MTKNIAMSGQDEIKQALAQLGKNAYDAALMGMNATGRHMQRSMRAELPKRFTMRGTASQFERAIVFQQATRGKLVTVAGVDSLISFQKRKGVRESPAPRSAALRKAKAYSVGIARKMMRR
jgi:hypothetical protein